MFGVINLSSISNGYARGRKINTPNRLKRDCATATFLASCFADMLATRAVVGPPIAAPKIKPMT